MGIRFRCHHCDHELHVKDFQGGKRGRCPECGGKFRIPPHDADYSLTIERAAASAETVAVAASAAAKPKASTALHGQSKSRNASLTDPTTARDLPPASSQNDQARMPAHDLSPAHDRTTDSLQVESAPSSADATPQMPRALESAPDGTWYVRPISGGQYGPAPSDTFMQWLLEGRISQDALVWRDGWEQWISGAQAFPDYFAAAPSVASMPPPVAGAPTPALNSASADSPAVTLTHSERNRLARKRKKRVRYIWILSILTVLFICLIVALLAVMFTQQTP
ncbi:MAG: GYF domain-containing protein [Pirellulaceae bacterium]